MRSEPSTTEYITGTSCEPVQVVAPVVDMTGERIASSDGHSSLTSPPVVSVHSSSGRRPDRFNAASSRDAISVQSSQLRSAVPQSSSGDEEVAQAWMAAATCRNQNPDMQRAGAPARRRAGGPAGRRVGGPTGRQVSAEGGRARLGNLLSTKPGRHLFAVSSDSQNRRAEGLFGGTNVLHPL